MTKTLNTIVKHINIRNKKLRAVNRITINQVSFCLSRIDNVVSNNFMNWMIHPMVFDRNLLNICSIGDAK